MNSSKLLLLVVGESGSGKSTFIEAMGFPSYHCVLSQPMIEELKRRDIKLTHDNIHSLAKELYEKDKYWQVAYILEQLKEKNFLIPDGLRYAFELERLRQLFSNVIVMKIISTSETRYNRLCSRNKVGLSSIEEFRRLEKDELQEMDVPFLMDKADIAVENAGSLDELKEKAERIGNLFRLTIK